MPDPPRDPDPPVPSNATRRRATADSTSWRRPRGVAPGTWRYVHEGTIATRYDEFVATTPLCSVDLAMIPVIFADVSRPIGESESVAAVAPRHSDSAANPFDNSRQKKWVLDLGCGTGRAAEVLARLGYDVFAVDLSLPMLSQVVARRLESVRAVQANLVELDCFAESIADGAVCLFSTLGMIQGREHRRRFLSHVRRIVRPEGKFFLHVHHRYAALTNVPGCKQLVVTAIRSLVRKDWEFGDAVYPYRGLPDMFLHQFSRRELVADFDAAGWRVLQWSNLTLDSSQVMTRRGKIAGGFLIVLQ